MKIPPSKTFNIQVQHTNGTRHSGVIPLRERARVEGGKIYASAVLKTIEQTLRRDHLQGVPLGRLLHTKNKIIRQNSHGLKDREIRILKQGAHEIYTDIYRARQFSKKLYPMQQKRQPYTINPKLLGKIPPEKLAKIHHMSPEEGQELTRELTSPTLLERQNALRNFARRRFTPPANPV